MRVLVVNVGSSSVKLSVLDGDRLCTGQTLLGANVGADVLSAAVRELGPADAVGHRIVHGGERYVEAVQVDGEVLEELRELEDLAPLHQARSLDALVTVSQAAPEWPQVACFDTAFHATLPAAAATYALPQGWRERWGLRRFGFHGLSHAHAARRAAELLDQPLEDLRIVTCHLGAGASLAAVKAGRSVDTTMGFTPLDGLAMATRCGSVDPGLLLWLLEHTELTEPQIAHALEHESGMLALAGSADMHVVTEAAADGDADAELAVDVYVHRLRAGIAAMAAAMGGLDAIAWTGGVGEHAPTIRAAAAAGLEFLSIPIDRHLNLVATGDQDVSAHTAVARTVVITAREDLEIARQVRQALRPGRKTTSRLVAESAEIRPGQAPPSSPPGPRRPRRARADARS